MKTCLAVIERSLLKSCLIETSCPRHMAKHFTQSRYMDTRPKNKLRFPALLYQCWDPNDTKASIILVWLSKGPNLWPPANTPLLSHYRATNACQWQIRQEKYFSEPFLSGAIWSYAQSWLTFHLVKFVKTLKTLNPCPAEPRYTLPLQTVQIQISWLLKKPTDLDLHCLLFSIWLISTTWIK